MPGTSDTERQHLRVGESPPSSVLVWAFVAFLALEYLRPPELQALHLQMLFVAALPVLWLLSEQHPWSTNLTLQSCFIATGAMMLPFARNNYEVYLNTRVMLSCFVTALATTWLMGYRRNFHRVIWSFVTIMCVQALYAITHHGRGHGDFLGDENDLAIACDMVLPFGLVGLQVLKGRRRWFCGLALALLVGGVVASFSRGGFIGLAVAMSYCLLAARQRIRNLAIGGIAVALLFAVAPSKYLQEILSIREASSGTAETRRFLWITAIHIWMDYPIFGVGPYNSKYRMGEYQPSVDEGELFKSPEFRERDWSGTAVHSLYFELLADRGLVGIVLFAGIALLHFRTLRRLRAEAQRGAIVGSDLQQEVIFFTLALEAAMAGFLAAGAFLSMASYPHFWFLSALAGTLYRAVRRENARRISQQGREGPGPDWRGRASAIAKFAVLGLLLDGRQAHWEGRLSTIVDGTGLERSPGVWFIADFRGDGEAEVDCNRECHALLFQFVEMGQSLRSPDLRAACAGGELMRAFLAAQARLEQPSGAPRPGTARA